MVDTQPLCFDSWAYNCIWTGR